ncbi:hypothetical protein GQ43DRAFT_436598 [Delitschia confertaspora ATCC 74209]|uniref:EF hand n=1 Tax=Delitschia confertaspora ATCC 74209 TaxID=1513339 RepID=A0A9P4JWX4_9PLEO|nr:hypothetical protein GQ43DRAFT_436598 [Delitschia confertaspora ATCC 74209]
MAHPSASSLSRHRPAIAWVTGTAAALAAAYLIYTSLQSSPPSGLHRSNATRRPRQRTAPTPTPPRIPPPAELGEVDFLGTPIHLNTSELPPLFVFREVVRRQEPSASPDQVDTWIRDFFDTALNRIVEATLPSERGNMLLSLDNRFSPELTSIITDRLTERPTQQPPDIPHNRAESVAGTEASFSPSDGNARQQPAQALQQTIYHIAEEQARNEGVIHRGITCDGCNTIPIRGIRWRCTNCKDFDFCSDCEATQSHNITHIFQKIRVPVPYAGISKQPVVYPGRPDEIRGSLNASLKKCLTESTHMEGEEIDALWDQFTCLASIEWAGDPNKIGWAIERRSFNQVFIPRYPTFTSAPNLIYDRIFAYYDTNKDGFIGFEEFVKGLDGLHSRDPDRKLRIVFDTYDIDGDGYISRRDVLRLFRAYYAIEQEAVRNYVAESLDITGALDKIRSNQPLGSAFDRSIPSGLPRRVPEEGIPDQFGDYRGKSTVEEDLEDVAEREEILGMTMEMTEPGQPALASRGIPAAETVVGPNGQNLQDLRVRERWERRQFYVDEEEGLRRPPNHRSAGQAPAIPDREHTRSSRSSSRVRFQDDVDAETHSNASTSSRPIGERWGGYEIPEPEKDLGKDLLYQITQQGFNELLEPLFFEKEDLALNAAATRALRQKYKAQLERIAEQFNADMTINRVVAAFGAVEYCKSIILSVCGSSGLSQQATVAGMIKSCRSSRARIESLLSIDFIRPAEQKWVESTQESYPLNREPSVLELWSAYLVRMYLCYELRTALLELSAKSGWIDKEIPDAADDIPVDLQFPWELSKMRKFQTPASDLEDENALSDPTFPQFRPNSSADITLDARHDIPTVLSADAAVGTPSFYGDARALLTHNSLRDWLLISPDVDGSESLSTVSANIDRGTISCWFQKVEAWRSTIPFLDYQIRRQAAQASSLEVRLCHLAVLDQVDGETEDRKGMGLLNFEEFKEKAGGNEGRRRFLELWVDWVSF